MSDIREESFRCLVEAAGLSAEQCASARRLLAFLREDAEKLVEGSLAALGHCRGIAHVSQVELGAGPRQGWVDIVRSLGDDVASDDHRALRIGFGAACARAGVPMSLLLLQHGLLQRAAIERIVANAGAAEPLAELIALLITLGALDLYLVAEGYCPPEIKALRHLVEELREQTKRLHRQASTDQLTGVLSYGSLVEMLEKEIRKAQERGHSLCVMMADLDFFKNVNDRYGHLVGDLVLRHVAERIQGAVRGFDTVGRFGGEEFTVVLRDTDISLASVMAERIRAAISSAPIHVKGTSLDITVSLGVSMLRQGDNMESLLERADEALYRAKQGGRNCVVVVE